MDTTAYIADLEKHVDELKQVAEEHATIGVELRRKMCAQEEHVSALEREIEERTVYENEQRQKMYDLGKSLHHAQERVHQLINQTHAMRNCTNCNAHGCHDGADESVGIACVNNDRDKWEFTP